MTVTRPTGVPPTKSTGVGGKREKIPKKVRTVEQYPKRPGQGRGRRGTFLGRISKGLKEGKLDLGFGEKGEKRKENNL